jgi:hypothetical protein
MRTLDPKSAGRGGAGPCRGRRGKGKPAGWLPRGLPRLALVLCLLFGPGGWGLTGAALAQPATVAKGSHVNLRADKTDGARILRILPPDTPVEVLEAEGPYARVKLASGETGWVASRFLIMTPTEPPPAPPPVVQPPTAPPAPVPQRSGEGRDLWWLAAAGAAGFLLGALVGVGAHEAYYRKRLNGLRI